MFQLPGFVLSVLVAAQGAAAQPGQPSGQPPAITLPPVTVTAQKEPADARALPVSVTTVPSTTIRDAGIDDVGEAATYAPNTYFSDFTVRKLSNPRFRGIGTSPANPGITTYIDGVPQLNTNSSSLELLDIGQIEFVRGPQSSLFGRNALGGVINVVSGRPSLGEWTGRLTAPIANHSAREFRGTASGPLGERVAVGLSIGHAERDGFTTNTVTGNDVDYRKATFGKAQLLWTPTATWEARLILSGERARDGDYALHDLASLRRDPYRVSRDFEGRTNRDVFGATLLTRHEGPRLAFTSTTGVVRWKTDDLTDLDYTPLSLIVRQNLEEDVQFTQELRLASAAGAPVRLADGVSLRWQAGAFFFTQNYEQDAVNEFSPFLLSPFLGFPVSQHSPQAELEDAGFGLYTQGTATIREKLDVTAGARVDYETKDARLDTFFDPPIAPGSVVEADESFANVSPQVAVSYRVRPEAMTYVSVARGFKAGGFNPTAPAGSETYGEEYTWLVEGGVKSLWAGGRISSSLAVFHIDWDELQLNLPDLAVPGQFYIANVGGARSRGVEVELNARPAARVDVFGAFGYTNARFSPGSVSGGANVAGNRIPNTPSYTATIGAQLSHPLTPAVTLYGRGEAAFYGAFEYDEANTARQDAYGLANFRAGARGRWIFAEAWVRNAFDVHYIPVAFAYGTFAPSGFVGESGRPRTYGVSGGFTF